jgi:hypothetical protein
VELFEACGLAELVEAALDGYSVTVFAFGQTGSGKTHTIIGPRLSRGVGPSPGKGSELQVDSEDGVLVRCLAHAYTSIASRKEVGSDLMGQRGPWPVPWVPLGSGLLSGRPGLG